MNASIHKAKLFKVLEKTLNFITFEIVKFSNLNYSDTYTTKTALNNVKNVTKILKSYIVLTLGSIEKSCKIKLKDVKKDISQKLDGIPAKLEDSIIKDNLSRGVAVRRGLSALKEFESYFVNYSAIIEQRIDMNITPIKSK